MTTKSRSTKSATSIRRQPKIPEKTRRGSSRRWESTGVKRYDAMLASGKTTVLSEDEAKSIIQPGLEGAAEVRHDQRGTIFPGALNRLTNWDLRLEKGNLLDDRTPFYIKTSRKTYKSMLWSEIVRGSNKFRGLVPGSGQILLDVEASQLENFGPQSQFLPWSEDGDDKVEAVMSDKPIKPELNRTAMKKALKHISSLLPRGSIHKVSLDETVSFLGGNPVSALDPTKNSGAFSWISNWGRKTADGKSFRDKLQARVVDDIMTRAKQILRRIDSGESWKAIYLPFAATASQRTVSKGMTPLKRKEDGTLPKVKRVVLAMPKVETVLGKTIMIPLQAALAEVRCKETGTRLIPAWSPTPVLDKNMQLFLDYADRKGLTVLSGDISSFDATLPPWLMWECAKAMAEWMDKQTANLFLLIMYSDIYRTTVLTPTRVFPAGPSSVKSGSIFTSLIGCIANFTIQLYGYYAGYYKWYASAVMGDDFVSIGPTPEENEHAFADLGMSANASKAFYKPKMLHFLQRTHVLGYPGGMGSVARICGNMLSVEDDTTLKWGERNKYTYLFQGLARLENAWANPLFEEMVRFMENGDSMRLGKSMTPAEIEGKAGDYAKRKLDEDRTQKSRAGSGVPFERWAVNRVLRGERMPPVGKGRWEWYYGVKYDTLAA